MEHICLSEGRGYYFPPCHIMEISGFRVLFDCPMDLSSLAIFSPVPVDSNTVVNGDKFSCSCQNYVGLESNEEKRGNGLICAEPRYRTVKNLLLWNVSFIDVVLISNPMGMLGLPFLTRNKDFSAKVYATDVAARIGQLMMEDLVNMHKEFRQFYGPESDVPTWLKWDKLELLPLELKQSLFGADGTDFGCWKSLYSAADVKACMLNVDSLKYAEEVCYNGTLIVKAFGSGLEIGSCNWRIDSPKGTIAYISSSIFRSATATNFNYEALQTSDLVLYSDFSSPYAPEQIDNDKNCSGPANNFSNFSSADVHSEASSALLSTDEFSEEIDKLDFICSNSMDSIKAGGSVLIPTGRLGIILQLLDRFELHLASEIMKVPIFVVSSVAEELMAFTTIIPEWLCGQLQDRLYSGQPLFKHVEMLKDGRLYLFPDIHSVELLKIWQEPCIVFCPHWSLRLGPVTHLLRRWCGDQNSLLVMEEGVNASLALLPFNPIAMKVLQCPFLSGMQLHKSHLLLKILQPRHVLFPEKFRHVGTLETSFSLSYYQENEMLHIPYARDYSKFDIDVDLAGKLEHTTLKEQNVDITRLKGNLIVEQARYRLCAEQEPSETRPVLHMGKIDSKALVLELQKMGMDTTVEEVKGDGGSSNSSLIHVSEPSTAVVEVTEVGTLINAADEKVANSGITMTKFSLFRPRTLPPFTLLSPPRSAAKPRLIPLLCCCAGGTTALSFSSLSYGPSLHKGHSPLPLELPNCPSISGDTLDEAAFTRVFEISALRVPSTICSALEHRLRGHLLNWPRIKNIARVPGDEIDDEMKTLLPQSENEDETLVALSRRIYGKAEGDGEPLNAVLYRDELAKNFNSQGYARFRNLAKMSRPKKVQNRYVGEKRVVKGVRRSEGVLVEVVEVDDSEDLSRLLGDDVKWQKNWRGSTRLLLLDERYSNKRIEELPEAIKVVLTERDKQDTKSAFELVNCKLTLFYDYWQLNEILEALLPKGMIVPSAFETVGHIAHLNLRDEHHHFKNIIAKVVLDKNKPKIQTVVNKVDSIQNDYRTMQLEVLAGNNSLVTTLVENGLRFQVDLAAVYWNSRLATERQRLLSYFSHSDVVCDVFAGVGPIAISAAKKVKYVYANDLNPCAVEYLERNCVLNKLERKMEVFNMDGRRFIETVFANQKARPITQVVMNLPQDAAEFLDSFKGLFHGLCLGEDYTLPRIHVYGFSKAEDPEFDFDKRIRIAVSEVAFDVQMHRVRLVAPGKWMLCASFVLPERVTYSRRG